MFTWTETPLAEIWRHMRYLQSPANVGKLLDGTIKSGRPAPLPRGPGFDERAYFISSCIRQADEYFSAAETVDLVTQPLLQFYGSECLAKAAILANLPLNEEADLNYHGLSTRLTAAVDAARRPVLQSYRDDPTLWKLEDEFAITNEGVFQHFCRIVGDKIPRVGEVLRLHELLRLIPDMQEAYERHYGQPSVAVPFFWKGPESDVEKRIVVYLRDHIPADELEKVIPELRATFTRVPEETSGLFYRSRAPMDRLPDSLAVVEGTVAGTYLVKRHSSGIAFSPTVLFAAMFIMSNVVRYKPAFWMHEIESSGSGAVALIEGICNLTKRRFTNDILETIWKEKFTYATPAYLA